jgi:hypothetical protein
VQTIPKAFLRRAACVVVGSLLSTIIAPATSQGAGGSTNTGPFLFDKETFGGNGRTCGVCHGKDTETFSIEQAQARFAKNPNDPLFRSPDSDNLDGQSYERLLTSATIKIDVPLAPQRQAGGRPHRDYSHHFPGNAFDSELANASIIPDV